MLDKLGEGMSFSRQALSVFQERQQVLTSNIANADTPHYKARDIDFSSRLSAALGKGNELALSATSDGHIKDPSSVTEASTKYRIPTQASLDGNTVDMDTERAQFADNSMRYQISLQLINGYFRGMKSAMQD